MANVISSTTSGANALSSIAANISLAANGLANLILATPQTTIGYQPQPGPGQLQQQAIVFHYEGEQTGVFKSDITDHYVEDNTAIQDQIALHPEMITTHGFIGEVNDLAPNATFQALQQALNNLIAIGSYTPALSTTALNAYNESVFLYDTAANAANSAISAWASLTGGGGETVIDGNGIEFIPAVQTKQQIIFQQLYGYWKGRILFTIQTPWAVFQNMAIDTLRVVQDAETNVISDFELTFKLIRFADTLDGIPMSSNSQIPLAYQSAGSTNASSNLTPSTINFASNLPDSAVV